MLLDNLLKPGIVDLHELGQIMNVRNNIPQILLEHHELLLSWGIVILSLAISTHGASAVEPSNNIIDLPPTRLNASVNLARLALLPRIHTIQLNIECVDELRLLLLGPFLLSFRALDFQQGFEALVVDVRPLVLLDDAGAQLLAELHDDLAGFEFVAHAARSGSPGYLLGPEVFDD